MSSGTRIRLCMQDLYHQDVVEMIERETRKYEIWTVDAPDHPDFRGAYDLLWEEFGASAEMEPEEAIRSFLLENPYDPSPTGTFMKYFLIVARGADGKIRGVRDGTVLVNPTYCADLCVVYLAHIYMLPEARGTVLSYWLRIAAVEVAVRYLFELHSRGLMRLPAPDKPGSWFGMRMNLTAEMEFFAPENLLSLQRILFYGRGGFDVVNPRHFPYSQPDFRPQEEIRATGNRPVPFMMLLRRMGRERQAWIPIEEAWATMRLLYDDFASFCAPEFLRGSLDRVMRQLDTRRKQGKDRLELLPLPTGPHDLMRLKRIWRYQAYQRYYRDSYIAREYLTSGIREQIQANPRWLEDQLSEISANLSGRPHWVYGNRDKYFTFSGAPITPQIEPVDPEGDGAGADDDPLAQTR